MPAGHWARVLGGAGTEYFSINLLVISSIDWWVIWSMKSQKTVKKVRPSFTELTCPVWSNRLKRQDLITEEPLDCRMICSWILAVFSGLTLFHFQNCSRLLMDNYSDCVLDSECCQNTGDLHSVRHLNASCVDTVLGVCWTQTEMKTSSSCRHQTSLFSDLTSFITQLSLCLTCVFMLMGSLISPTMQYFLHS